MKVAAIHQPQFLPYLGFFHKMLHSDVFVMLDNVQYLKRGFNNRNKIKNSQGEQWLTVPVQQQFRPQIRHVQIDNEQKWGRKIWNSLSNSYSRSAYFHLYEPELKELFEREWQSLLTLDDVLMRWAMKTLKIDTPIIYASDLTADGKQTELLVNICREVGADFYLSGPGGKLYMEMEIFEAAGIEVIWQEFKPPTYQQLFPKVGFISNLSVIDAIFCCGQQTKQLLLSDGVPAEV